MAAFTGMVPKLAPKPLFSNGHWQFSEQMGSIDKIGFIYVIRDNYMGRFYLGKKSYRGSGKLNKGVESKWRSYMSSSNTMKEMFHERDLKDFDFIVLEEYKAKGALAYAETWSLCFVEAPTTPNWYNKRIEAISWSVKERVTDRHKERLQLTIEGKKL
jgi:hypothetical protein